MRVAERPPTGKKVAVIGSGPCGLTAAYYLSGQGHRVTVYEALPLPGGMLRYGIPEYRLPEEIVDREIALIRENGVELITGTPVSSAASLREKGFDAVFVATGAWKPVKMGIPGEDSPRVVDGLSFLRQVNEGKAPAIGRKVIVVGGGNTAIDASRVSVRLGAEVVQLYRRSRAEMPAGSEEIAEAVEEGVRIEYLTAPVKIENGEVTCIRMRLWRRPMRPAGGRRFPIAGSEFTLPFDTLIMAIGQSADAAFPPSGGREERGGSGGSGQSGHTAERDLCRRRCGHGAIDHHRGDRPGKAGLHFHRPVFGRDRESAGASVGEFGYGAARNRTAGHNETRDRDDRPEATNSHVRSRGEDLRARKPP